MKKNILFPILILAVSLLSACTSSKPLPATVTPVAKTQVQTITPPADKVPITNTATPRPTRTETPLPPTPTPRPTLADVIYWEYDPTEWEFIPGSDQVHRGIGSAFMDSNHWLWVMDHRDHQQNLRYYDGKDWGTVSLNTLPYTDIHSIACISSDGTIWLLGSQEGKGTNGLIRYRNKQLDTFPIPNPTGTGAVSLTDDHRQGAWVLVSDGGPQQKHLYHFDGINWQEYPLPYGGRLRSDYNKLRTDALGYLWLDAGGINALARFDGNTWRKFEVSDIGFEEHISGPVTFPFASGSDGSVWVVREGYTIYRFYPDDRVDKITAPFLGQDFGFMMRMFVDNENHLWVMETTASDQMPPLFLWDGAHWNTFTRFSFKGVSKMLPQGDRLMVEADNGWYWYTPKR